MNKPAWPGLDDPQVRVRARDYARSSGLWDKISNTFNPSREIPVLKHSSFRDYHRTGSRAGADNALEEMKKETYTAALALWLEHPKAHLDYLQDLLWAWCEMTWWHMPYHEPCQIDLVSSMRARDFTEYSYLFADILEPEVRERISKEVAARVLDVALDYHSADWWQTTGSNWNSVCNANIISTAFYEIKNPFQLATFIHHIARRIDYAIDYFANDGACVEGVVYWDYGFGHLVEIAVMLHQRTGGAINLMQDEKLQRIARFPLATALKGPIRSSFADGGDGYITANVVLKINHLAPQPELLQLVSSSAAGFIQTEEIRTMALYRGDKPIPHTDRDDYFLPDFGYAKAYMGDFTLAALAGRNDVSHNHNDIGSFILLKNDTIVLADPGTPVYTSKTFSGERYEILVCRSKGHSVPLINGLEQKEGDFFGTITTQGLNVTADKTVTINATRAYDDPTLLQFIRELTLEKGGAVRLADRFEFHSDPTSLEEAFMTFEPVQIGGNEVKIGTEPNAITLSCDAAGEFCVQTFSQQEHGGRDERPLQRISFLPHKLSREMRFTFLIR